MAHEKNLFDTLYGACEETLNTLKKPLVKKAMKRKYSSALDDCENKIIDAEQEIQTARSDFENFDLESIFTSKQKIEKLKVIKEIVKSEYKEMFDEDIKE